MSLETEVQALTVATTDLLEAVNIGKQSLDAAENAAELAAAQALESKNAAVAAQLDIQTNWGDKLAAADAAADIAVSNAALTDADRIAAEAAKNAIYGDLSSRDAGKGAELVAFRQAGTGAGSTTVQAEIRAIEGYLTNPSQDPLMLEQPLDYLRDSIGFGYSNGEIHINGNLQLGAIRNLLSTTNNLSLISTTNATKDTTRSIKYRNITMQRAFGSNFYSQLFSNLGGSGVGVTAGKKYLASCYAISLSDQEKFIWMRGLANGGDFGHGAKLVDRNVRRIWALVQATTNTNVDLMPNPTVTLGSGPNANLTWICLNKSNDSFDVRIGGFQLEQVPDDTKAGVAVIGDSTTAGSSGEKDLAASSEWTRWAEAQLNVPFFNRGIGGNTTANMRARWVTDMTPLAANANYAIIQGGINDIAQGRTLVDIQADIQWMHDQAITDGMESIVCTCTPTSSIEADPAKESIRQQLNVWIKQTFALVLDFDMVVRDPIYPSLLRQLAGWVGDGVHFDTQAKRALGVYVAKWPFWNFITPSPYQERTGNAASVDPVRAGTLFHVGSGYSNIDVAGTGIMQLRNNTRLTSQVLELSGALTGNRTVYIQGFIPKLWFIRNTTSGAFSLSVGGVNSNFAAVGGLITIVQGKGAWILSTGTGLVRAAADAP